LPYASSIVEEMKNKRHQKTHAYSIPLVQTVTLNKFSMKSEGF
jgi:hypothetical protein